MADNPQTTNSEKFWARTGKIEVAFIAVCAGIFFGIPLAKFTWDYTLMFWFKVPI